MSLCICVFSLYIFYFFMIIREKIEFESTLSILFILNYPPEHRMVQPAILTSFKRKLLEDFTNQLLPSDLHLVLLEDWFEHQPNLYKKFRRSVKTSVLPKKMADGEVGTIVTIVSADQRLVSFLHVNILSSNGWSNPFGEGKLDCYLANSATPHECDQRKGYNTILRNFVIDAARHVGLERVVSAPLEGANSSGILDKLGFRSDGKVRYLDL